MKLKIVRGAVLILFISGISSCTNKSIKDNATQNRPDKKGLPRKVLNNGKTEDRTGRVNKQIPAVSPGRMAYEERARIKSRKGYFAFGKTSGDRMNRIPHNTETYDRIYENRFLDATENPLSTFSVDVDTASYSNMRRFLNNGQLPPKDAVRIEELINYFSYKYSTPVGSEPFSVTTEVSSAPWNPEHRLLHIGIAGRRIDPGALPARNLVFLLDVSGSMRSYRKLPLLKRSMKLLVNQLSKKDTVSIVVYAGSSGLVLPPTSGDRKHAILSALNRLQAGGSTNGGQGIRLAYKMARKSFARKGINRVILCTDGDFNVGLTNQGDLIRMIEKQRESGVFLTVLGFGMGNYKDSTMEKLADKGNGNYAYIDNFSEARKVLVNEAGSTLVTIAKDVKLQIEFNPKYVKSYRLIGYENRMLRKEDFNNDKKDAGEIGAGHTVTALYEIVPVGVKTGGSGVDPLKYQKPADLSKAAASNELLTIKIRHKKPTGKKSRLLTFAVKDRGVSLKRTSNSFRFSAGVAAFGMLMRDSKHKGNTNFRMVRSLAEGARGRDIHGYRAEFIRLIHIAEGMKKGS